MNARELQMGRGGTDDRMEILPQRGIEAGGEGCKRFFDFMSRQFENRDMAVERRADPHLTGPQSSGALHAREIGQQGAVQA